MKVSKSLLQAIAVAVTLTTTQACTKEKAVNPQDGDADKKTTDYNCPPCGRG